MKAITFRLELLEPMLCVGLEGDPNAGVSLKYIPGSVLRGAVIGKYGKILDAAVKKERELFFDGTVRYLNAYPVVEGKRSLPVPLSWHIEKDTEEIENGRFYDFVRCDEKIWKNPNSDDNKIKNPKSLNANFFTFKDSATIYKAEVKTRLAVHTQRDAKKGRSTSESGAVFRYESIAKGTKFDGAIISERDDLLNELLKRIPKGIEIFVGGSRTSGYGKAKIIESKIENWQETNHPKDLKANSIFTVTLLSHALVRDENGQLQANISEEFDNLGQPDEMRTYKRTEIVGGFNRKWGLPLPQVAAIKAGSVFTFKAKRDIPATEFQILIDNGIGEKRLDGFGRIAVNLSENDDAFSFAKAEAKPKEFSFTSIDLGKKILKRIVNRRMEEKLLETIANYRIEKKDALKKSQISRLRLILRNALRDQNKNIEPIVGKKNAENKFEGGFFNELKRTARDQFQSVKVSGGQNSGSLQHWVTESLDKLNLFGRDMKIVLGNASGTAEADNKDDRLQLEYHLRLIDGVLARAAKETKQ